ncbi:MAG: 30S ribosomal protein S8 [Candidatus Diapherotrites archaeon]
MSVVDPLADALTNIKNNEGAAKKECTVRPASKILGEILKLMKSKEYILDFERVEDGREGMYRIRLAGKINECKAIKPRYAVKKDGYEKYEKRYLPSREIGILVVSTPKGVLPHQEAKNKGLGGRLLAYVY